MCTPVRTLTVCHTEKVAEIKASREGRTGNSETHEHTYCVLEKAGMNNARSHDLNCVCENIETFGFDWWGLVVRAQIVGKH